MLKFSMKVKVIILIQIIAHSSNLIIDFVIFVLDDWVHVYSKDSDAQSIERMVAYSIDILCEDLMYFVCLYFGFRFYYTEIAMNINGEKPKIVVKRLVRTGHCHTFFIILYIVCFIYNISIFWYSKWINHADQTLEDTLDNINKILQIIFAVI